MNSSPRPPRISQFSPEYEQRTCGSCSLCCKVLEIQPEEGPGDLKFDFKPYNTWCTHCAPGSAAGGCKIYLSRPTACAQFKCLWLQSQERNDVPHMPLNLKPSRSHCIFIESDDSPNISFVFVDPSYPDAHKREPIRSMLITVVERGRTVIVVVGAFRYLMTKGKATVRMTEGQLHELVQQQGEGEGGNGPVAMKMVDGKIQVGYASPLPIPLPPLPEEDRQQ